MLDFQLFRVKVYPSSQHKLFEPTLSRPAILREAIKCLPSADFRKGLTWHVGNLTSLDDHGLYFRVGRISKSTIEVYEDGIFLDEEFETAPYTHVIMDVDLSVCAIAKKTKLSPHIRGIARQFGRLLDRSTAADKHTATFEIDPISDPEELISYLGRASSIMKFSVTFKRPNPFDANADFIKPMQSLLSGSGGDKGKTQIEGDDLNAKSLEALARSAAATGDQATALMSLAPDEPRVTKYLKGNPVVINKTQLQDKNEMLQLLTKMRKAYRRVRNGKDGN